MQYDYDIIIVGAGPAGLIAGANAADIGASVLIMDKKTELGKPVRCGEAVIENVFRDFNIKPRNEFISNRLRKMLCVSSKGKKLSVELNLNGYILDRIKFEEYLGNLANDKGVEILLGATVLGMEKNTLRFTEDHGKSKKKITGRIFIGADGVESRLGRWASITKALKPIDIGVCLQYVVSDIEVNNNEVEFYWGGRYSPHGYMWVFPKSDNKANVGILSPGNINVDLKGHLDRFLKERAPKFTKLNSITGAVPQTIPPKPLVKDNVMVVGDAARLAIPVTGGGIGHAMVSGRWAGEVAGKVAVGNEEISELNEYEDKVTILRKKISRANRLKEKIIKDDDIFELLFGLFLPFQYLYKISPKLIEKYLLKSLRY